MGVHSFLPVSKQAEKSAGVHSFLPVSKQAEKSAGVHSFFPVLVRLRRAIVWGVHSFLPVNSGQRRVQGYTLSSISKSWESNRVYPCTLLCLLTNWQERVYPHTIALPSLILERKSVPLHSSLPAY